MCGNGIRCVAKYVYEHGMTDRPSLTSKPAAGIKTLYLNVEDGVVKTVRVCMGSPEFASEKIPVTADTPEFINQPMEIGGTLWSVTCVNVGNPHAVVFVDDVDWLDLPAIGPLFENDPRFPRAHKHRICRGHRRAHAENARLGARQRETLACGTGSTASLAAAVVKRQMRRQRHSPPARRRAADRVGPRVPPDLHDRPRRHGVDGELKL